jgi:hypothetical protein
MSRTVALTCDIDIEQSWESFHAHAIPDGIDIMPGDVILVHNTEALAAGNRYTGTCSATLTRAGFWRRRWTQFYSIFELSELYEVGFQPYICKAGFEPGVCKG